MQSIANQAQLQHLRTGDRLKYHGVEWKVKDYSTYDDPYGYKTEEWLLKSGTSKEYYLLREVDPQNPESLVNWYIAEEIKNPKVFEPNTQENIFSRLRQTMQDQEMPYPELQMFGRTYYFESRTKGTYEEDDEASDRITWDYWDTPHQWNLALEAWQNGELHVYSTKVVKPEEFSQVIRSAGNSTWLIWLRVVLASAGIILLVVGCSMFLNG